MAEDRPSRRDARPRPASPPEGGSGADTGWSVTGTLISGMAVWGGAGWLLDRWLGISVLFPVGIILGMAVAVYLVVVKYGGAPPPTGGRRTGTTSGGRQSRPRSATRTQKGQR